MALVPSTFILSAGVKAPDFTLPDPRSGKEVALADLRGSKGTLIVFACNHCPYVVHLAEQMGVLADEIAVQGVNTVAISANDVENYPQDGPIKMLEFADASAWKFPYLYDASQEVAKAYSAACTPDFFLFDSAERLYYAGQFDDSRPNSGAATGDCLKDAVAQMLKGEAYSGDVKPATGCNIKWKSGNEPEYFG